VELSLSQQSTQAASTELDRRPQLHVRAMAPLIQFVIDKHGEEIARKIVARGELTLEQARATSGWLSVVQLALIFQAARDLVGSDEAFIEACGYRAREAFGPFAYVAWAARPGAVIDLALRSAEFFSRVGSGGAIARGPGWVRARYTSREPETRLICLSRKGIVQQIPTIWGMPRARVRDIKCLSWGDPCCEYEISWTEPITHTLLFFGTIVGGALALGLERFLGVPFTVTWAAPLLGGAVGHFADSRSRRAAELRENRELRDGLTELTREADDARREFHALSERQREWLSRIEAEMESRSMAWQAALSKFEGEESASRGALRAVSHDLANPLQVLRVTMATLEESLRDEDPLDPALIAEHSAALRRVEKLFADLNALFWGTDGAQGTRTVERIEIAALTSRLDRRIHAFALGRSLRIAVFANREAPERILVEPAVFDRILDNLLTNAVKYTVEGSIVVELSGSPDTLVIKISDTGRGIEPSMLQRVFEPEGSTPETRAPGSRGIGLSNVVRLVGRLRGKIEVLSRVGRGTTFWVHVPVSPDHPALAPPDRILQIRRDGSSPNLSA
jgi:signal transduction histidine kinase